MHYEGRVGLARVHTGSQNDSASYRDILRLRGEIGDDDHLAVVACDRLSEHGLPDPVLALGRADLREELAAVAVGVGIAMREVHLVVIVLEGNAKSQCLVKPTAFLLHAVLVITDVVAVALPTYAALLLRLPPGIDQRLHPLVVGALRLDEVDDVELIGYVLARVADLEEEPLSVVVGAIVVLEYQIVFELPDLDCASQVARLEATLEDERRI